MKRELVILVLSLFISMSFASATITLSDVNSIYNLGDRINLNAKIIPQSTDGKFEINLLCAEKSINLERMSAEARFIVNKEVVYSTIVRLLPENIEDLRGNCFIRMSLSGDSTSTKSFQISDKLIVSSSLDKERYNPGEEAIINLDVKKENGEILDGFFSSQGLLSIEKPFYKGKLIEKFKIPTDIDSGDYEIKFSVYDSVNGNILNKYEGFFNLIINSVPSTIQTAISDTTIDPGENLSLSASLFDQSGKLINELLTIVIISPKGEQKSREVRSGEINYIELPSNTSPGIWKIKSKFSSISEEREFEVNKLGIIETSILDNILIVKNIGNSEFTGSVDIVIGEEIKQIEITNLKQGNEKRYEISAPDGEYNLQVQGEESFQLFLTGGAIGIKELRENSLIKRYSFIWIFILVLFLLLASVLLFRLKQTPFKLAGYLERINPIKKENKEIKVSENFSMNTKKRVISAEHSLVLKGEKQNSSVIVIKVNDSSLLNKQTSEEISNIFKLAEKKQGVIERRGDYSLIIFHPLVTRSFSNENDASEIAFEIYKKMNELNKKISKKFVFGIGLHKGDIVAEIKGDKLNYTSIENTVLLARKMADLRENKIYVSEDFRRKLIKELRVEKSVLIGGIQIYSILNFSNKNDNSAKLEDLLKRIH